MNDFNEILKLASKVDLSNPVIFKKFEKWKEVDGSINGLKNILQEQINDKTTRVC